MHPPGLHAEVPIQLKSLPLTITARLARVDFIYQAISGLHCVIWSKKWPCSRVRWKPWRPLVDNTVESGPTRTCWGAFSLIVYLFYRKVIPVFCFVFFFDEFCLSIHLAKPPQYPATSLQAKLCSNNKCLAPNRSPECDFMLIWLLCWV